MIITVIEMWPRCRKHTHTLYTIHVGSNEKIARIPKTIKPSKPIFLPTRGPQSLFRRCAVVCSPATPSPLLSTSLPRPLPQGSKERKRGAQSENGLSPSAAEPNPLQGAIRAPSPVPQARTPATGSSSCPSLTRR